MISFNCAVSKVPFFFSRKRSFSTPFWVKSIEWMKKLFFFPEVFFFHRDLRSNKKTSETMWTFPGEKNTEKYPNIREKIQPTLLKNRLYAAWLRQILNELRMEFSWLVLANPGKFKKTGFLGFPELNEWPIAGQTYQLWGSQKEVFKFLIIVPRSPKFTRIQTTTYLAGPSFSAFFFFSLWDFISNWYENWEIQVKPDKNLWKDGLSSFP